jgi:2-keto-4-pentenoate hydratase/2-oxohepta-3-ene-1,7-dioic acid hydratase in catechol pathway
MEAAPFFYLNAANVVGASTLIPFSDEVAQLECEPYLAAVIAAPGRNIPVADADSYILGLTIMSVLVARDIERRDHPAGMAFGRAYDLGLGVGPVITTLEELDDVLIDEDHGRRHDLEVVVRINGVEKQRGNAQDMPYTFGQLISFASETSTLRMGDIIAMGPVASGANFDLSSGDDVQVAIGQLGALSLKIS